MAMHHVPPTRLCSSCPFVPAGSSGKGVEIRKIITPVLNRNDLKRASSYAHIFVFTPLAGRLAFFAIFTRALAAFGRPSATLFSSVRGDEDVQARIPVEAPHKLYDLKTLASRIIGRNVTE